MKILTTFHTSPEQKQFLQQFFENMADIRFLDDYPEQEKTISFHRLKFYYRGTRRKKDFIVLKSHTGKLNLFNCFQPDMIMFNGINFLRQSSSLLIRGLMPHPWQNMRSP